MTLGIYGAGGLGREILVLAQQINNLEDKWDKIIFIEDNPHADTLMEKQIIAYDDISNYYSARDIEFIIAVGEPHGRHILRDKVKKGGFQLTTLIHPSVFIPDDTKLGEGVIIGYNCFISCNIVIGDGVLIQQFVNIGHDSIIGNDSVISAYVCVAGACCIGESTYIGMHVPIREKIKIGSQTIIGMGAVVVNDISDLVIAIGNPARVVKNNDNLRVFK